MTDEEVDNPFNNIEKLESILNELSEYFSILKSVPISRDDILEALYLSLSNHLELNHPLELWDLEIKLKDAQLILSDFDFNTVLHKVELDNEFFPKDLLVQTKVQIKSKGSIWHIHKYDLDPFPSNPHAHHLESRLKLNLKNGECYRKRKLVHKIKKKELLIIREKAGQHFDLPELEV